MQWLSPAKINLYLAITGIRDTDGFHELDSLVALLDFGDTLFVDLSRSDSDTYACNDERLSWSADNLIRKAVDLYREQTGFVSPVRIELHKRIPLGAGLGGGSSNASTMLKALNAINPNPVTTQQLQLWSAELGSDCPLFFGKNLLRMRGRGERISEVCDVLFENFKDQKILLFHPGFGISAAWAYQHLRAGYPNGYTDPGLACNEIERCFEQPDQWQEQWRNDLQTIVENKFMAIRTLKLEIEQTLGLKMMMSGSGSACFCISKDSEMLQEAAVFVKERWGDSCFIQQTSMAELDG